MTCGSVRLVLAVSAAFMAAQAAQAVPPYNPENWPTDQAVCRVNTSAIKNRAAHLKAAPFFKPPITSSTAYVAVIMVDFSDKPMTTAVPAVRQFFSGLRNFYTENSYGVMLVSATLVSATVFRMPQTHSFYANALSSKYDTLIKDAVTLAQSGGTNFATGAPGGAAFHHLMIYHAGIGAETSNSPSNHIWSVFVPTVAAGSGVTAGLNQPFAPNGVQFNGATIVPELEDQNVDPLGVICHEYGHQLGLPDLYKTPTETAVGKWSLMDAGIYLGGPAGSNPAHLDAWSKQFLGFSTPETFNTAAIVTKTLTQAETSRSAFLRLPINVSDVGGTNEYFLLEYRRKSGATFDTGLPGQGMIIWHIDDSIGINASNLANNTINANLSRRAVDVVEADGSDTQGSNQGDAGDPWTAIVTFQSPRNHAYNGRDPGFQISDINGVGTGSISFNIGNPLLNPAVQNTGPGAVTIASTSGDHGFVNPARGERAVIAYNPASTEAVAIKIYSVIGDLVFDTTVSGTVNVANTYQWDGKNKDGTVAASGIYLVHVSGGGIDSKKKIAILK